MDQIRTARLLLRAMTPEDVDDIYVLRSFEGVYRWSMHPKWESLEDARTWIRYRLADPRNLSYVIEPLDSTSLPDGCERVIGSMGIHHDVELGYQYHPGVWGRGYATEALTAFLQHVFDNSKLDLGAEVRALVSHENAGSIHVLEKVGFVLQEKKLVKDTRNLGATTVDEEILFEGPTKETLERLRECVQELNSPGTVREDMAWPINKDTDVTEIETSSQRRFLVYIYKHKDGKDIQEEH